MKYLSEVHGQGGIYAKVVAASTANGIPIYTLETCAPKFIDAEFEKHRMLSSNSSSSRAMPFKPLDEIYIPFDVRANQKGMQGYEPANEQMVAHLKAFSKNRYDDIYSWLSFYYGEIHKQHLNRYLEPWMFQKKVVTATEWDNFFKLRLHPDAQPEIQELARCMKEAMEMVEPTTMAHGAWHLPYVGCDSEENQLDIETLKKCSVARCARVSYLNHDKSSPDIGKDLALAEMLRKNGHMSPFEHQATPIPVEFSMRNFRTRRGITHCDKYNNLWSANFRGWIQNRQLVQ